ncbi:MAG: preprotein translocase subunit SecA [Candidatus Sumerlaeia bacterium]
MDIFTRIIRFFTGDKRAYNFKKVKPVIDQINAHFEQMQGLSDEELKGKTAEFRARLADGATLDDLLPEAFAAVKEACRRLCGQSWVAGGIEQKWEMVPFDVQLCGAIYLHRGNVAEMATGEGKTLVASMPLYLNALEGKGSHLVTVNDYLARRDSEWMGKIYETLGMTVGVILTNMSPEQRRAAYNCDITYGTNNEFGFDYLRDNMTLHPEHLVQRDYHFAIVDEVDSVLIDEARTPLIISGQVDRSTHMFDQLKPMVVRLVGLQATLVNQIVADAEKLLAEAGDNDKDPRRYEAGIKLLQARKGSPKHKRFMKVSGEAPIQRLIERAENDFMRDKRMAEVDEGLYFVVDERSHTIDLTEKGRLAISPENPDLFLITDVVTEFAAIEGRGDIGQEEKDRLKEEAMSRHEQRAEELHNISQLLRAYLLYEKDVEYVIQDNKILIVDEFTGRLMPGRRWSDGLHQAVEAKEGVTIEKDNQTLATITLQNYFRMYKKLAGMTGTAETEAEEFAHTYKMNVAVMPTNRPIRRVDQNDLIYKTKREKYNAIVAEIQRLHKYGLPILVGTTSVEVSEIVSKMLTRARISHSVLNAKQHEKEAQIVQNAGQIGAVTIATNMAGRGTDIKLGAGVLEIPRQEQIGDDQHPPCSGLQIIGTERHEARRIDRQLRGRSGRQGDPGSSRFFVSLEDDLMRMFASERMARLMASGFEEGQPLEHRIATKAIESAQKKIEGINFETRKRTLEYDNVMNKQREAIYGLRRRALVAQGNMADEVLDVSSEAISNEWAAHCDGAEDQWDIGGFREWVRRSVPFADVAGLANPTGETTQQFLDGLLERIDKAYEHKSEVFGPELMNALGRHIVLTIIDQHWRDHLLAIDQLREGIGLRGYGQKDPLVEYQLEATLMFEEMMASVYKEIFEKVYRVTITQEPETGVSRLSFMKEEGRQSVAQTVASQSRGGDGDGAQQPHQVTTYRSAQPRVKPNDPCPCGSGRKYKKCCGAVASQPPAPPQGM